MPDRAFIDTNIFVYINSDTDIDKRDKARSVLNNYDCIISTQVTNELSNVLGRKFSKSADEIKAILTAMETVCDIAVLTLETTRSALDIQTRYNYSFYDALILSTALENNCRYVISEDLQDRQIIEGRLTILNPFS